MKLRNVKHKINIWSLLSTFFVLMIILPNADIVIHLFNRTNENWHHIKEYLLKDYVVNSIIITFFTAILSGVIGVTLAWLISAYEFPGRNFFKWALILPLAIPPYIAAYTYNGILNYTGIVQKIFRNQLGIQLNPKYLDIMSIKGSIFIFTIFLFPYVYMITKAFLEKQSAALIENARLLGRNSIEIFFRVIMPISRAAITAGVTLVILEVLNDYGVVSYFGVQTFSTAIFKTWFSMGDVDSAVRLSSILMMVVLAIILIEKLLRGRKKFSYTTTKISPLVRQELKGYKKVLAFSVSFIFLALGFIIPTLQLISWSILTYKKVLKASFLSLIFNSLWTSLIAAAIVIFISLIIANYTRLNNNVVSKVYSKITLIGYSIPAAVISIAVILFFVDIDHRLSWLYKLIDPALPALVLSTSIFMLLFAYIIRFLSLGYQSVESGFDKVGSKFTEASRTLGHSVTKTFLKVDYPMIKPAVISGFALVFVDIIKELPLTLTLRPFNFNTLATRTFEYANDEMIHEASISSLIIVLVSFICIYMIYKAEDKENKNIK